jgi:hypothetical protein
MVRFVRGSIAALLLLTACSSSSPSAPSSTTAAAVGGSATTTASSTPPAVDAALKVAVIVMENHEASAVIGSTHAPYFNGLVKQYAVASNWFGITHPSLPNYLAMISGSTFGVTSDCTDCVQNGRSLPDQLDERGISWKTYQEGLPSRCFLGASAGNGYAKKHNPFVYFKSIVNDKERCQRVVPFSELARDEQAGALPRFTFITPDLCNDTHDCGVDTGDKFLAQNVPALLNALGPSGLMIITYDEGSSKAGCCERAAGGRVATLFAGPLARTTATVETKLNHYSMLRTIEDLFGLEHLGEAGCACTPPADELLRSGR